MAMHTRRERERRRFASVLVAFALLGALTAAGCSAVDGPVPADPVRALGGCSGNLDVERVEGASISAVLQPGAGWVVVDSLSEVGDPASPPEDLTVAATLRWQGAGSPSTEGDAVRVSAHQVLAQDIVAAQEDDMVVLADVQRHEGAATVERAVADEDGRAVFLGLCAQQLTDQLDEVLDRGGHDRHEGFALVRELAVEGRGSRLARLLAEGPGPTTPVVLVPGEVDDELLAGLVPFALTIAVPEPWRASEHVICTRVAEGWNDCSRLDLRPDVTLRGYAAPGAAVDVVLLDAAGRLDGPRIALGSFDLDVPAGTPPDAVLAVTVELSGVAVAAPLPASGPLPPGSLDVAATATSGSS